jgi:hypothetical protein
VGAPPDDDRTTVVPQHAHRDAGVIAFTAHSVVCTDEDPQWVRATLRAVADGCGALAATMNARFLAALLERTGRTTDTVDALLVGSPCRAARRSRSRRSPTPATRAPSGPARTATTCGCGRRKAAW